VAADFSVATMVAPTKVVTATAEAEVADVTVPILESANYALAEVAATVDLLVPVNVNAALFSGGMLFVESVAAVTATEEEAADADVTFPTVPSSNLATAEITATVVVPIDTAALFSKGMAFVESAASGVCVGTADFITDEEVAALDVAEGHIPKRGVSVMCFFCMNSYLI
jgi:hypothetical protein